MPSVQLEWPASSSPGRKPGEHQGVLINAYTTQIAGVPRIRRVPGLRRFLETPEPSPKRIPRGQMMVNDILLHAWDDKLHAMRADKTDVEVIGDILGTEPVSMARNLRPITPNVVIVTQEQGAQVLNIDTMTLEPYPGGLASAQSVEYYSGYFFFTRQDGTVVASDLQQLEIPLGSEALTEYVADYLWCSKSVGSALLLMGSNSIEFWVDVASSPFPCQRQHAIDVGLLSRTAVAGGSNHWEHGLLWVAGDWTVRHLRGYDAVPVSTDDVVYDIRKAAQEGQELVAQAFVHNAQPMWMLSCDSWSWVHNLSTGFWHKRESYLRPNWRGHFACLRDQQWIVQDDHGEGWLQEVSPDVFDEDGERMRFRVESKPLKEFPVNFRIPSIDIDMTVGLGDITRPSPYETDPVVMVSWSHNGGATWSNPVARTMGAEGRYATKVTVNNLGRTTHHGLIVRLDVVDPVWVQLAGAVSTRTKGSRPRSVNM